jgi:predicted 3-demethylubiquinone-9 3-methyltransferase (glyoxalase superfamily)
MHSRPFGSPEGGYRVFLEALCGLYQIWVTAWSLPARPIASKSSNRFNEAISFIVYCDTQEEIDYYWEKLSAVPEAEQCGWLKDKYGLSWQIVPTAMGDILKTKDKKKLARVTEAFLKMKKFDIKTLKQAYEGNR